MGVVDVTVAEYCSFQIAVLIEAKQGVVTFAAEIAVLGRTLLLTVGFADRAVQVQNQLLNRLGFAWRTPSTYLPDKASVPTSSAVA